MRNHWVLYILLIVGLLQVSPSFSYNFTSQSVLASGNWVKIRVKETGLCKLSYEQLKQMGFKNPAEVRIFGYGGAGLSENILERKTDDLNELPVYQGDNFFLFYAQGPKNWYYKENSTTTEYDYSINPYSNYGYYFLSDDVGSKRRITKKECQLSSPDTIDVHNYQERQIYKKEEFNYVSSGNVWYGDKFYNGNFFSTSFNFPYIDTTKNASVLTKTAATSVEKSVIDLSYNFGGTDLIDSIIHPQRTKDFLATESLLWNVLKPQGSNFCISAKYRGTGIADYASVERIIVLAYQLLDMRSTNTLYFRNPSCNNVNKNYRYILNNCPSETQIWDISNPIEPKQMATEREGTKLSFVDSYASSPCEYVAFNINNLNTISAEFVSTVTNQNLHAERPVDYVIITHPKFMSGAIKIAKIHEETDNFSTLITTQEKIFNEFSSGTPDATAIRWFMKKLYQENGEKPFFLLLIGDGCFDNRGILATEKTKINNLIVTYQGGSSVDESDTYVSDDYFCCLSDELPADEDAPRCISVGRIPCNTEEELNGFIGKIKSHIENKNYGKWKNKIILLGDDNETSDNFRLFMRHADNVSDVIHEKNNAMEVKKVYLDAYTRVTGANGSRYPEVENIIKDEIDKGVMIFNYIGHSSKFGLSAEMVFTQNQARTIHNERRGLWIASSCEFARYDDLSTSGGENLLFNPNGGALTLLGYTRVAHANLSEKIDLSLYSNMFLRDSDGIPLRIGEIVRIAKDSTHYKNRNKMKKVLLGDPALRLFYPNNKILTDSIIEIDKGRIDTARALSEIRVYGHITDKDSAFMPDFNGTIHVTLYDKEMTLYTKANIYTNAMMINQKRHQYKDRPNVLYTGMAEVTNGKFSILMKIPKSINYNYGEGRLSYYAFDEENEYEAQGAYEDFIIGGSCEDIDYETDGPSISLYLNTKNFVSGDKVNSSPVLYANLFDESGINASGCGIGHDITLTLNESKEPIILNDYFSFIQDSYKEGNVAYQLKNLGNGTYTLTLKAWDLMNNSSTKSIQFVVDNDLDIEVEDLIVYPNPAKDDITLTLMHDHPQTIQSFRFILYDINGKIVYKSDDITSKNDGQISWTWDLCAQTGRRIDAGCYIGRAEIKINNKKYVGKTKKVIILPQ